MQNLKFKIKITLNEAGRRFHGRYTDFIDSKSHEVISIDIKGRYVVIDSGDGDVCTVFDSNCKVFELMQFSGFKDKNIVDIYVGDMYKIGPNIFVVEFYKGAFCGRHIASKNGSPLSWRVGDDGEVREDNFTNDIEILGNIHD